MSNTISSLHSAKRPVSPWADLFIISGLLIFFYFFLNLASRWSAPLETHAQIELSLWVLPIYAFYSLMRALIAYAFSLLFTLVIGFVAAKNEVAEKIILPLLDIGQSIPVLGFLPGLVLGLIALFPNSNIGLEFACIIMIFTGQVWNMTFAYYSSLKGVPTQFHELSQIMRLNWFGKLINIELPFSATALAWNSLMSMAGGWFFLTLCESFSLKDQDFRIPGLGSYMQLAIEKKDTRGMIFGVIAMMLVIIFTDFVIWRPIIAWSRKFRLEDAQDQTKEIPFMVLMLQESRLVRRVRGLFSRNLAKLESKGETQSIELAPLDPWRAFLKQETGKVKNFSHWFIRELREALRSKLVINLIYLGILGLLLLSLIQVYELVRPLTIVDWTQILKGTGLTALRVFAALGLASAWAIPAGIWIGSSPKLIRFFQPLVQIAASFPAPMLYPLALMVLTTLGAGIGIGSVVLMLLGVQWYILFNVMAGASTISLDLLDTLNLIGVSKSSRWLKLYLPSVFPSLVTGWITAAGGAWNASIVAEFITYDGKTLQTLGLGAMINQATSSGNFSLLAGCLLAMCVTVVGLNRSLWRSMYRLAESRFRFER